MVAIVKANIVEMTRWIAVVTDDFFVSKTLRMAMIPAETVYSSWKNWAIKMEMTVAKAILMVRWLMVMDFTSFPLE
jgi:hypothetical protein